MKKFNKISSLCLILCLLFSLAGCFRTDVCVEIKSDGTGSITSKISIEESVYSNLVAMGHTVAAEMPEDTQEGTDEDESVDLEEFEFDEELSEELGEEYYSYSVTKDNLSLSDLVDELYELELENGKKLFSAIEIQYTEKRAYTFKATTNVISSDDIASDDSIEMPDDWFVLTMTVKMPGSVVAAEGGDIIGDATNGTARFTITNFDEAQTISVKTEPETSITPLFVLWGVGVVAIIFCLVMFFIKKKNIEKEAMAEEPVRTSDVLEE